MDAQLYLSSFAVALLACAVAACVVSFASKRRAARKHEAERRTLEAATAEAAARAASLELAQAGLSRDLEHARDAAARLAEEARVAREEWRRSERERQVLAEDIARRDAEARAYEARLRDLAEAKEAMRQSFAETANALMAAHGETFKAQNSEQLGHLLAPLKNDLDSFKKSLGDAHIKSAEQHGSLREQLELLARQSASVSKEAENLTRALKSDVQLQGAWGEMKVETILQRLGLREGVEYTRQESFSDASGRVRTDFIVNLPHGEKLIIDSKVSLTDFEASINAACEEDRAARLAAHVRSMRAHVKGLASREYHSRVGTRLDFVIMFVPIEGALAAAVQADEALTLEALDQKVAIATPTTLTTQMKTVAAMWRVERQHRNAEDIAARAGRLYDKFASFVVDLQKIGQTIGQSQKAYDEAFSKLTGGAGNLVRQTEMLRALGASATKAIPGAVLADAGAETVDALLRLEMTPPDEDGVREGTAPIQ